MDISRFVTSYFTWMEQLEKAVCEEMSLYKEEWELKLDELEKEIAYLLVYDL